MTPTPTNVERILPHAADAEQAILGGCLYYPDLATQTADSLKPDDFYLIGHRIIYAAILAQRKATGAADLITVTQRLRDDGKLEEAGGQAHLTELLEHLPGPASFPDYLQLVLERAIARRLILTATQIREDSFQPTDQFPAFLDRVERDILAVTQASTGTTASYVNAAQATDRFLEQLADRMDRCADGITGIPTGLRHLDHLLSGYHNEFIIVGARPSVGKSSYMMSNVVHQVFEKEFRVLIFSLEEPAESLIAKAVCILSGIDRGKVRHAQVTSEDMEALAAAAATLRAGRDRLLIEFAPGMDVIELRRRARLAVRNQGVQLVYVDHFHKLQCGTKLATVSSYEKFTEISNKLVATQKELGVPVVALAQLNRDSAKRDDKAPRVEDLRNSGTLEEDADAIILLHRPGWQSPTPADWPFTKAIIAKQRHGPLGEIDLLFDSVSGQFRSVNPNV
jgi:replicative DNA helicase